MKLSSEVYTPRVQECKEFYCTHFGFVVKTEDEGFVMLQHLQHPEYELIFCVPHSPFVHKLFHPEFCGKGILFQMEVDNVEAEYQRIQNLGLPLTLPRTEEPVNGEHFTVTDPAGFRWMWLSLVDKAHLAPLLDLSGFSW